MQIKAAVDAFFAEFSKFETNFLGLALRALSKDPNFVEKAEKLLGLEARLTLLERMAFVRGVPEVLMTEMLELFSRTRKLCVQRDDVTRALVWMESDRRQIKSLLKRGADFALLAEIKMLWTPSLTQIEIYSTEAIELQQAFRALAEQLDAFLSQPSARSD